LPDATKDSVKQHYQEQDKPDVDSLHDLEAFETGTMEEHCR
jgi:hypothetical protein